jgi:cytochrome c peroxidase
MISRQKIGALVITAAGGLLATAVAAVSAPPMNYMDLGGVVTTLRTNNTFVGLNPFFYALGTNGRSCGTCHNPANGFGLTPVQAKYRYALTKGTDPLFASVDGANCPGAKATDATAHSLMLNNALVRISVPVPAGAQFTVETASDPYGCAITEASGQSMVSEYRRPLPASNLAFETAIMYDGRETIDPIDTTQDDVANLTSDLTQQAIDAVKIHMQATTAPSQTTINTIVGFEIGLVTAQSSGFPTGFLNGEGATGGPTMLVSLPFQPGMNDPSGASGAFNPDVFTMYAPWASGTGTNNIFNSAAGRESVARGEEIFNELQFDVSDVGGFNGSPSSPPITATCSTCHNTPGVGNHSSFQMLDLGTGHASAYETDAQVIAALQQLHSPTLPTYEVTCNAGPLAGQVFRTSDLGRALISGQCEDISETKVPVLRGLQARAPYFHNGSAASLTDVVDFYNARFGLNLSAQQKADLTAFLASL